MGRDPPRGGIAAAVEHLIELGHEEIGLLCGRGEFEHVRAREAAWSAALAAADLMPGPVVYVTGDADAATLAMLEEAPTAVICCSDALALGLETAARAAGVAVPEDLSVIGFDDSALAALGTPALTSVRVEYAEFGAAAATALLARIDGEPMPGYSPSAPELVERASTARRRRQ